MSKNVLSLIFMPECKNMANYRMFDNHATTFLQKLIDGIGVHSLEKIIITGSKDCEYNLALQQYGSALDKHINVTNTNGLTSVAVVIHGVTNEGNIKQFVFLKDFLYAEFIKFLMHVENNRQDNLTRINASVALSLIVHEIGHALEYQTVYEKYGYTAPDKKFNLLYDYDEYVGCEAMQLWSEYFAERIAEVIVPQNEVDSLDRLIDYIKNNKFPKQLNAQLGHSYRVAYIWVNYLAVIHTKNGNVLSFYNEDRYEKLIGYKDAFGNISDTMFDLFKKKDSWDFRKDSARLTNAFLGLINCEKELYT